ncbi:MAG: hypothetical protein CBC13_09060 [Planctomycetia bacterium TMED53]|nr:MAG: hypothetical protein CBC13_09060 [Planctomycetia bacterium TMED53]
MTSIDFAQPWILLWALPALAITFWLWRSSRASTSPQVRNSSLTLRVVAVLLLVASLAGVSLDRDGDGLTLVILRDLSDSVSRLETDAALEEISRRLGTLKTPDQVALISFGGDPALEQGLALRLGPGKQVTLDQSATDISSAFRYAASFLSANAPGGGKRVILLSDGNPTEGDVIREARNLAVAGISVDVWPLIYDRVNEVLLESVSAPQEVEPGQTYEIDAVIESTVDTTAMVTLLEGNSAIATKEVLVGAGRNRVSFPVISEKGTKRFQILLEPAEGTDSIQVNNAGSVLVTSRENSRVLLVSADGQSPIGEYLSGSQILVEQIPVSGLSSVVTDYTNYSAVILDNVSYFSMRKETAQLLERLVYSNGLGLLMVGGADSFGAGGWKGTPVEEALPVTMDIRQRKIIPNGALAIILHTCEFPQGNLWARQISMSALDALTAKDYFGLLIYKNGVDGWGIPMRLCEDKESLKSIINTLSPEDMLQFTPSMQLALTGLNSVDAYSKHMIIISDGDPVLPSEALLQGYVDQGIKISTICIQPHSGQFPELTLRKIAKTTGGRFYRMDDPTQLPRIFFREALQVRKNLIDESTFQPVIGESAGPIQGLDSFPPIEGIVLTTTKPLATEVLLNDEEDPLVSLYRHGIGISAVFTSDSGERWSSAWSGWEGNPTFWAQMVRTISRPDDSGALQAVTKVDGRGGVILLDAIDEAGQFVDGLDLKGSVINPDLKSQEIEITQDGPGRYIGNFPVRQQGDYLVRIEGAFPDGSSAGLTRTFSVGYPAEFRSLRSDEELLGEIALESGGRIIDDQTDLLERSSNISSSQQPLWPLLIRVALLLFFVDVVIRRIHFGPLTSKTADSATTVTETQTSTIAAKGRDPILSRKPLRVAPPAEKPATEAEVTAEEESGDLKALLKARKRSQRGHKDGK